jgi:hypothetical protein
VLSVSFERVALAAITAVTTVYLAGGPIAGPELARSGVPEAKKDESPTVAIGVPPEPIMTVSAAPVVDKVVDKPAEGDWLTKRMMRIDPVTGEVRE